MREIGGSLGARARRDRLAGPRGGGGAGVSGLRGRLFPWGLCGRRLRFLFQPEDGIRGPLVTGVQTCALPILPPTSSAATSDAERAEQTAYSELEECRRATAYADADLAVCGRDEAGSAVQLQEAETALAEIGRASCRERGCTVEGAESVQRLIV